MGDSFGAPSYPVTEDPHSGVEWATDVGRALLPTVDPTVPGAGHPVYDPPHPTDSVLYTRR